MYDTPDLNPENLLFGKKPADSPPAAPAPEAPEKAGSIPSNFAILRIVIVLLVAVFLMSGFFKVDSHEKAIVQRQGKIKAVLGTGIHWVLPHPIEEVIKIPSEQVLAYLLLHHNSLEM